MSGDGTVFILTTSNTMLKAMRVVSSTIRSLGTERLKFGLD